MSSLFSSGFAQNAASFPRGHRPMCLHTAALRRDFNNNQTMIKSTRIISRPSGFRPSNELSILNSNNYNKFY